MINKNSSTGTAKIAYVTIWAKEKLFLKKGSEAFRTQGQQKNRRQLLQCIKYIVSYFSKYLFFERKAFTPKKIF